MLVSVAFFCNPSITYFILMTHFLIIKAVIGNGCVPKLYDDDSYNFSIHILTLEREVKTKMYLSIQLLASEINYNLVFLFTHEVSMVLPGKKS